jgi:hypothetical protein
MSVPLIFPRFFFLLFPRFELLGGKAVVSQFRAQRQLGLNQELAAAVGNNDVPRVRALLLQVFGLRF